MATPHPSPLCSFQVCRTFSGRVGTVVVGPHSKMSDNSSGGQIISTNADTSQLPSSSQGFRIGGRAVSANETELTASPGAVRQTLRDFWGSKFDAKSGTSVTQPPQSKVKEEEKKSPKAKCPGERIYPLSRAHPPRLDFLSDKKNMVERGSNPRLPS